MSTDSGSRIVVIGGVACGPKAAARAGRRDPNAKITIIERGPYVSYAGCGLPYFVGGTVPELNGLMTTTYGAVRDAAYFSAVKAVDLKLRTEALSIDRQAKTVRVRNLEDDREEDIPYDKLVVATGAEAWSPPIQGLDLDRVLSLHVPPDAVRMRELVEGGEVDHAVIIGAGRTGLETAEALFGQAVDVTIVELADQMLPTTLDADMACLLASLLPKDAAAIRTGEKVLRLEGADGVVTKVVTDKGEIECDMVLMAVGVRPNVGLAKAAGLEIGATGAIAVDDHCRTSDPDVYAGGDCAECLHRLTGKKVFAPLGSTANRHGRVIGDNLTGGDEVFPGVVGTGILKVLGINVAGTGLTETAARKEGYDVIACIAPSQDHAHYYPGAKSFVPKLVADAKTGKLLGGQFVGRGDVAKRADVLATAITFGATLRDVANLDLAYAPPFSTAIDALATAANVARNKQAGIARSISPADLRAIMDRGEPVVVLDVRERREVEKHPIGNGDAISIPLSELRKRVTELPVDKPVFCLCPRAVRAYEASVILRDAGLTQTRFVEGGMHLWSCAGDEIEG
ncbi:MAG: FAD-dependent oxidoreductase [Phycisphaerae bacterium]|nr:FAD-dependent oxidoreductase [Phycisphaerae bacterium]